MKPARKRKVTMNEVDVKHTENANVIVLRYLKGHKNCEFGHLFEYVNSELGKNNQYSRKGFSLRLEKLIRDGKVARRSYKQGHFLYYLTDKGEENIELISEIFRKFAYQLLRANFTKKRTKINKEHYVQRTVERIGTYMLFSHIYGLLQYTSPENDGGINAANMKEWEKGINPSTSLGEYLEDVTRNFIKFDNYDDMLFTPTLEKKSFYKILNDFLKILHKKFPEEYRFLDGSLRFLDWEVDVNRMNKMTNNEQMKTILEKSKKKL